jgi:hypothetical protein
MTTKSPRYGRLLAAAAVGAAFAMMLPGAAARAANVGVAAAVNVDAKGRPPGGTPRVVTLGQNVVHNEEIATDGKGLVQILLLDGTTFTVGPNSRLVIDEFVYDPDTGDAHVVASVTKGAFRFIGGQTSRQEGGAIIRTPVGTIGIRGAMVEGNVTSSDSALFSMIFGKEVRFTGPGGERERIFRPGFTLEVDQGAGGNVETDVRPRTQDDASTFQTALAGTPGQNGGAEEPPADANVAPVQTVNSELPDTAPIPESRPSPVEATNIDAVEEDVAQIEIVAQQELDEEIDDEIDDGGGSTFTPTNQARLLTAPGVYATSFGESFTEAGSRGLVGSTAATDRRIGFAKVGGRLVTGDAGINLPDLTGTQGDGGLQRIDVGDGASPDGPLSGPAYAGAGDFAAYLLGINGDPTRPFYLITGTPSPKAAIDRLFAGERVREYSLTQDPIRPSTVPYFAQDLFGQFSTYHSSNLYIVESNTSSFHIDEPNFDTKVFQSWVIIDGAGVNQKSGIGTLVSAIDPTDRFGFGTGRRGSFRYSATDGPANLRGDLRTLYGTSGGESGFLFGPDANNFVIGTGASPPDSFTDALLGPGFSGNPDDGYLSDGAFSTHHVGGLLSITPNSSLSRTSRNVSGFMTGVAESSVEGLDNPYVVSAAVAPNFSLSLDAQFNVARASAKVFDINDANGVVASYLLTFGPIPGVSGGANAFVNDDVFGATRNGDNANTRLRTDGGQDLANAADDNPGSYLVSGRANPIPGYQHCATCDFIDWGWWGTRVVVDPSGTEVADGRKDYVHMGTWVAGDITHPADMPSTGSASYNGTALGTVMRNTPDGVAKYIAKGNMNMGFNFNTRTGSVGISNFDGMNVGAAVAETSTSTQALFSGGLTGSGMTGVVNGAFVNNGALKADGVIGVFSFGNGAAVRAEGTIAGRRTQ